MSTLAFADIPKLTRTSHYRVSQSWQHMLTRPKADGQPLQGWLDRYLEQFNLELCPDFQRGHVWSEHKQREYVEYRLRGGELSGVHIFLNHPNWGGSYEGTMQLVDGLQRITAATRFLNDELRVFDGHRCSDITGHWDVDFTVCINNLKTRVEVLQWYLDLNAGGVVHSDDEIARVRALIAAEQVPSASTPRPRP